MVKELVHDPKLLACKSTLATKEDLNVATDLVDTLNFHRSTCVGMAANMIGVNKCIIAFFNDDSKILVMFNPVILKKEFSYETEEGCLSLLGGARKCRRFKKIKVEYQTIDMKTRIKNFSGFTAQIIQHEIDHCNGVLI